MLFLSVTELPHDVSLVIVFPAGQWALEVHLRGTLPFNTITKQDRLNA